MQNIPTEISKLKVEMNRCFDIYGMLEGFKHKFTKEDMDKRWIIYGFPRETMDLVDKRNAEFDKEKAKFEDS